MLLPILAAATLAAGDSTVYPVLNHGRVAGSMVVVHRGDTVTVRLVYTDRNRGARVETRYVMRGDSLVHADSRPVLANGETGEPTIRLDISGDSIRRVQGGRTVAEKAQPGTFYSLNVTPFDEVQMARYLMRRPGHKGSVVGSGSASLDIVKETTVRTSHGNERVRLVTISTPSDGSTPDALWLDSHDDLFASEISWFMTVKAGAEPALPALRKLETEYRDAQAEALNTRLVKPTNGTIAIVNGDVFDSERGVVLPSTNVIIRGDRIVERRAGRRRASARRRDRDRRDRQDGDAGPLGHARPHAADQRERVAA